MPRWNQPAFAFGSPRRIQASRICRLSRRSVYTLALPAPESQIPVYNALEPEGRTRQCYTSSVHGSSRQGAHPRSPLAIWGDQPRPLAVGLRPNLPAILSAVRPRQLQLSIEAPPPTGEPNAISLDAEYRPCISATPNTQIDRIHCPVEWGSH